jgi:hypothetical protein
MASNDIETRRFIIIVLDLSAQFSRIQSRRTFKIQTLSVQMSAKAQDPLAPVRLQPPVPPGRVFTCLLSVILGHRDHNVVIDVIVNSKLVPLFLDLFS